MAETGEHEWRLLLTEWAQDKPGPLEYGWEHTLVNLKDQKKIPANTIAKSCRKGQLGSCHQAIPLAVVETSQRRTPGLVLCGRVRILHNSVHNTGPDFYSRLYVCWFMGIRARSWTK